MSNIENRFWEKVPFKPDDGCWEWVGSKHPFGYGQLSSESGKRPFYAHRLSYEMAHGKIPSGYVVRHKCDNPSCVRPDHLTVGTQSENISDMYSRWRDSHPGIFGEKNGSSKLSDREIAEIRADSTTKPTLLAKKYGVTYATIWSIKKRLSRSDAAGKPVEVE